MAQSFSGGCLCGHIRFEIDGEPQNPHSCSCETCQRHSGASSVIWVDIPKSQLRWTGKGGAPALYRSSDYSSRAFCPDCGATLGAIDDEPLVGLVIGCFDDKHRETFRPVSHSFEDGCPAFARLPGMEGTT